MLQEFLEMPDDLVFLNLESCRKVLQAISFSNPLTSAVIPRQANVVSRSLQAF